MIQTIAYYLIFGKPIILYMGIMTFLSFLTTAYIGMNVIKPHGGIPFRYHLLFVRLSFALAMIHALLGMSVYFNF
jgi:hypothetical protein